MCIVDIDRFLEEFRIMLSLLVIEGDINGLNRIAKEGDRLLQNAFDHLEENFEAWTVH